MIQLRTLPASAIAMWILAHFCIAFAFAPAPTTFNPSLFTSARSLQEKHRLILNVDNGDRIIEDESQRLLAILASEDKEESEISNAISNLESAFRSSNSSDAESINNRFSDLIDLYEVQHVLSSNKKNNPVGGKWTRSNGLAQRLFRTRKTYQHLLPFNETGLSNQNSGTAVAEAINVISLDALDGLIRASIILRGDAVPLTSEELRQMNSNRTITPLSNLSVRALFDPPRIVLGRRNKNGYSYLPLQLGPVSNVVLDTTYYDKALRIGMGGTSGTRFVFARTNDEEAMEYKALLDMPLTNKLKIMSQLGVIMALSLYVASGGAAMSNVLGRVSTCLSCMKPHVMELITRLFNNTLRRFLWNGLRLLSCLLSLLTGCLMLLISLSSGGIERDKMG
jgi:hypothetical protein